MSLKRFVLALAAAVPLFAQTDDGCAAALDSFKETKDSFTRSPDHFDYKLAYSSLVTATRNCPDNAELWYFRSMLGRKGGASKQDIDQSLERAIKRGWKEKEDNAPSKVAVAAGNLPDRIGKKWALVIGIDQFQDSSIRALKYSSRDAIAFRDILVDSSVGRFPVSNVRLLTDNRATTAAIKGQIGWLRQNAQPEDLVVVYIASHGTTIPGDTSSANYIVTHDSKLDNEETIYSSTIQMLSLVHELTEEIQAFRIILFLDTCFSGDATTARMQNAVLSANLSQTAEFGDSLRLFQTGAGRVVMTSAAADQTAQESDEIKHGYFTYFLIEALKKSGGRVPINSLYDQVRSATEKAVKKSLGKTQTPLLTIGPSAAGIIIGAQPSP